MSELRSQDLVSLPVLTALLRERSVTRAAEAVGLTQPAASNALSRLRRRFDDDLLLRVGREYRLTPLAQSLLDRAEHALGAMERLFESSFDPATSSREFTLVLSDYAVVVLSRPLVALLAVEAPHVRFALRQLTAADPDFDELVRRCDGVVLPPDYISGHPCTTLLRDRWVCLAGTAAPVGDTLTVEDLPRLSWVTSFGSTPSSAIAPVRQLRTLGVEPRVDITVESFHEVPYLVAGSHRIAFVPQLLVERVGALPGLRVLPCPLPRAEHLLSLYWDAKDTGDPAHRWLRDLLRRAAEAADHHRG